jgi:hypothetical protein
MPTTGELNDRFDRIVGYLDHWGDVIARDAGAERGRRVLEFQLVAPGDDLEAEVNALFREYYRRDRSRDWVLAKYTYEYIDLVRSWRLAFHLHPLAGTLPIAHAHCEPGTDLSSVEVGPHLRAIEYDLREANAEFMRLYAADRLPDCDAFLPLRVERP